jgi:anti-sigma regulatory factor (Ser/Thr protein kinase)
VDRSLATSNESQDEALLRLDLPDREEAPSAARKALSALNGSLHLVSETRLADAQLLVSELVSNAVRHGGGAGDPVRLTVRATPQVMHVEVRDSGSGFDPGDEVPPAGSRNGGGWGLPIVAALAHRWGVDANDHTVVWFEIDRPQSDALLADEPTPPQEL